MGFGTLFVGYFLLLNIVQYGITDIIAAAIMLLGLYKLSFVNRFFKMATIASLVFLGFSACELGIFVFETFIPSINSPTLVSVTSAIRAVIVGSLTALILKGIENVAKEVSIRDLAAKSSMMIMFSAVTYAFWIVLEIPFAENSYFLSILSVITLLATIALLIVNLTIIYTCYMKICMPGDEDITKQKPSRFSFVNEYRARKAERDEEAARARAELLKRKSEEKKGNKK